MLKHIFVFLLLINGVIAITGSSDNYSTDLNFGDIAFEGSSANYNVTGSGTSFSETNQSLPAASAPSVSSGGGGGGGGSSAYVGSSVDTNPSTSKYWDFIQMNELVQFKISSQSIAFRSLLFKANSNLKDVKITVENDLSPDESYGKVVYQYINVILDGIEEENMKNIVLTFNVDSDWLVENGIKDDGVVLVRYSGNEWVEMPTKLTSFDGHNDYTVEVSSFSTFAISTKTGVLAPPPQPTPEPEPAVEPTPVVVEPTPTVPPVVEKPAEVEVVYPLATYIIVTLVLIISALLVVHYWPHKHPNDHLKEWVKHVKEGGYSDEQIEKMMVKTGYTEEQIRKILK